MELRSALETSDRKLPHSAGCDRCRYWEVDEKIDIDTGSKVPYRIEIVGVTCDPGLAVARGIWRQVGSEHPKRMAM